MSDYAVEIELTTRDNASRTLAAFTQQVQALEEKLSKMSVGEGASKTLAAIAQQARALEEKLGKMTGGEGISRMQQDAAAIAPKLAAMGGAAGSAGKQMTGAFDEANTASGGLMGSLKGLGSTLAGLAASLGALAAIRSFVAAGVEFNKTIETTRSGIAALVLSSRDFVSSTGQAASAQVALTKSFAVAEGVQARMLVSATQTAASYTDLVGAFQTAFGPATAAGITSISKLEKVTLAASQAVAALGLDSRQLTQEIRAIFTGEQGPDNTLNRVLGITKEKLDKVRSSGGDVADFLIGKMKPFMDAASASTGNFATLLSNARDAFEQMAGSVTKPIFNELKAQISGVAGSFDQFKPVFAEMALQIAEILRAAAPLGKSLAEIGVAALRAMLGVLHAVTPVLPVIKGLADLLAFLVEKFGAAGLAVYAVVRAYGVLTAAGALLTVGTRTLAAATAGDLVVGLSAARTALTGFHAALTMSVGAAGVLAAGVAALVAAVVLAVPAWKAWRENVAADDAWKSAAAGLQDLQNKLLSTKGVYLELDEVQKYMTLSLDEKRKVLALLGSQFEMNTPPAQRFEDALAKVREEAMRGKTAAAELAAGYDSLRKPVGDLLFELSKETSLGALKGVKRDLAEADYAFAEAKRKLEELFRFQEGANKGKLKAVPGTPEEADLMARYFHATELLETQHQQKVEEIRAKAGKESLEAAKTRNEALADLQRKADLSGLTGLDKQLREIEYAFQETKKRIQDAKFSPSQALAAEAAARITQQNERTAAITAAAQQALQGLQKEGQRWENWDEWADKAIQKVMPKVYKLQLRKDMAAGDLSQFWVGLQEQIDDGLITLQEAFGKVSQQIYRQATTAAQGVAAAWTAILGSIRTAGQDWADYFRGLWVAAGRSFEDGLYSVMSGRLTDLKSIVRSFADSVLKMWSGMIRGMVERWLAGTQEIAGSGAGSGTSLPAYMGGGQAQQGTGVAGGGLSGGLGILGLLGGAYGIAAGVGAGGGGVNRGVGSYIGAGVGLVATAGLGLGMGAIGGLTGGASAGAIAGSVVPIVGTIIGAIVGAILGSLLSPSTEAHLTGMIQTEMAKKGSAIGKSIETVYSGLVDVIVTAAPEQAAQITRDYRDALARAMGATRYDIAAGSNEDIQKNWEWLVNSLVPKMALQAAFGQVGMGLPHGNRDAGGGHGGFDWWSSGMDQDGNWVTQQLYDPNAPIPRMLAGLGFTGKKIEELARELSNVDDPKAYLEKLKSLVSVVVGINELQKKLVMTRQEVFTELDKGFVEQFAKSKGDLVTGFQNLGLYSGDEQIKKAQELIVATQQWYEQGLQYIGQLRGAMQNLLDSIDKQISSIKDAAKTWGQLMDDARVRANDAFKAVGSWGDNTKPEQMQKDTQAAMEAIGQIVSGLRAVMQAAEQAIKSVDAQVESMRTWNRSFSEQMATAQSAFATAADGLKKPGLSPEEISKLSSDALNAVKTLFDGFVAIVRAAEQEISAIETQVSEMLNFGKTPDWLTADATRAASSGMARLGQSGLTPEEITKIGGEVREAVKTLYEGFKAMVQAAKAAKEQIAGVAQSMRDWMMGPEWLLGDAKTNALGAGRELTKEGLSGDQITFWANKAIENVKRIFDAVMAKISALRDAMAQIDTVMDGLGTRIAQALGETPDQALARLGAGARGNAGKITATSSADDIKKYSSEAIAAVTQILDVLLERMKRLSQLDKDLKELGTKFGTAWADAIQEQMDATNPIGAYERAAAGLQNKVRDAALLSGDAQVTAIEDARNAALQMYEQQKQMLSAIARNAADLKKSIESQIWEIQTGEMAPQGQAGAVMERIHALRQQLVTASSPEVARQITDEIQSMVTRYLGLFGKDDPMRAEAITWATDLLKDVEKLGLDTYGRMQKQIEDANKLVQEALTEADGLVTNAMKNSATEIDSWRTFLEEMRGNLQAAETAIGNDIQTWANFLEGLQAPLDTAIHWASGQITAWANALDSVRLSLETAINWAGFQISAWANSLAGINFSLHAHINAAAAEIGSWTGALTALRTKIEVDFTTLIDNVLGSVQPLGDELGRAKDLFTNLSDPVLPGVTSSATGAASAMDGVRESAEGLKNALDSLAQSVNQQGGTSAQKNAGPVAAQKGDPNAVLRAIRLAPRLTFSQVGA